MKTKNPAILETTAAMVKFDTEILCVTPLALVVVLFVEPIVERLGVCGRLRKDAKGVWW